MQESTSFSTLHGGRCAFINAHRQDDEEDDGQEEEPGCFRKSDVLSMCHLIGSNRNFQPRPLFCARILDSANLLFLLGTGADKPYWTRVRRR
jgi:hypothetical protein